MASTGGVVYLLDGSGAIQGAFRPFEAEAARVPLYLAQDHGTIWIGAGAGGGPRLQARDAATLAVTADRFIGDPASRTGVSVAAFDPPSGSIPSGEPLRATSHPASPTDPSAVQRVLDAIPAGVGLWLDSLGATVFAYAGPGVTVLPEFAAYRGVETAAGGDGGRTWDSVGAATFGSTCYVRGDQPEVAPHEVGHAVSYLLPRAERGAWDSVWAAIDWATFPTRGAPAAYFALNPEEAFAESFRLWAAGEAPATVGAYFDGVAASHGWR